MYTKHAKTRMQQRGIDPLIVDLLLQYGAEEHDRRGATRRFFDKRARKSLQRNIGRNSYRRLGHFWDAYLVESEGQIVTVGWRHCGLVAKKDIISAPPKYVIPTV